MKRNWTQRADWQKAPDAPLFPVRKHAKPCPRCKGARDVPGQRYCRRCHAAYMRAHRAKRRETHVTISRAEYDRLLAFHVQ